MLAPLLPRESVGEKGSQNQSCQFLCLFSKLPSPNQVAAESVGGELPVTLPVTIEQYSDLIDCGHFQDSIGKLNSSTEEWCR